MNRQKSNSGADISRKINGGAQPSPVYGASGNGAHAGYYQQGGAPNAAPPGAAPNMVPPGAVPNMAPPGAVPNMAPPGAVPNMAPPGAAQNMPGTIPAAMPAEQSAMTGAAGKTFASRFRAGGSAQPSADQLSAKDSKRSGKGKKRGAKSYMISFFIKLGATAAALAILLTVFVGMFVCHDNNSYPMIKDGDLCFTYRLSRLSQGDEIAYRSADGRMRFGRVIAFGGETVEIGENAISVNGYAIFDATVYPTSPEGSTISYPYTVPDGCVFVLNDYRDDISDSRSVGGIPVSDIKGKVFLVMRRRGI